jgi:hypothetical protein
VLNITSSTFYFQVNQRAYSTDHRATCVVLHIVVLKLSRAFGINFAGRDRGRVMCLAIPKNAEHAKSCLRLAAEAPNELGKRRFEELARIWLKLATDLEAAKVLLERWGSSNTPEPPKKRAS